MSEQNSETVSIAYSRYSEHIQSKNFIITPGHSALQFVRSVWSVCLIDTDSIDSSLYKL